MKLVIKVRDIEYDTDGEIVDLPESMKLEFDDDDLELHDLIPNRISDETDFCISGYEVDSITLEQ